MFDPVQTAEDLYGILLCAPSLNTVNVVNYRKLRLQNITDYSMLVNRKRNGAAGAGIVVMEPTARAQQRNVLAFDWIFPIVSIECPAINDGINGSGITAYMMAQLVADIIHNHSDTARGSFYVDGVGIEDETEPAFTNPGWVSKRTNFHILGQNSQTPRCGQLLSSVSGGAVTVSNSQPTPGAAIYYTLDGSTPTFQGTGNPNSKLYSSPVSVTSGQTFRAMAFQYPSFNQSAILTITIP